MPYIDGPRSVVEKHPEAVIRAATSLYRDRRDGLDLDVKRAFGRMMPQNLGDGSEHARQLALREQYQFETTCHVLGRVAYEKDLFEAGGLRVINAAIAIAGSLLMDAPLKIEMLAEGGIIDVIRGAAVPVDQDA